MATNKAKKDNVYTTKAGLEITVKAVDPVFVQRAMASVEMPKRPTYEAKTFGGRYEIHPMDAESAKQTIGGKALWDFYQERLTAAQLKQNDVTIKALFLLGTECELPNNGWESKYRFLDILVPDNPDEKRAFYLASELPVEDISGLTSAIMKLTGVSEEAIADAEAAFRGAVREG